MNIVPYRPGMSVKAPCYIENMPADIYHAHDSISNSGLKLISRSPAHYKYAPKRESTKSMIMGSAVHMAVLEPELFTNTYAMAKGAKDRRSKEYKDLLTYHREEYTLLPEEYARAIAIRDSLWSKYGEFLSLPGRNELSGFSIDPETGVTCRHRFDKLCASGVAIDLKTCVDARPDAFSRAINNYGYHVQAAFYMDQHEWITGEPLHDFLFLAVESEAPYAAKMYRLNQESLEIGRSIYKRSIDIYANCRDSGVWPEYDSTEVEEISIPQYALNQYDQQQIESFTFMEDEV